MESWSHPGSLVLGSEVCHHREVYHREVTSKCHFDLATLCFCCCAPGNLTAYESPAVFHAVIAKRKVGSPEAVISNILVRDKYVDSVGTYK